MKIEAQFKIFSLLFFLFFSGTTGYCEDGYRLWLRYNLISDSNLINNYRSSIQEIVCYENAQTIEIALSELKQGLGGLIGKSILISKKIEQNGSVVIGTFKNLKSQKTISNSIFNENIREDEGYLIKSAIIDSKRCILIAGANPIGVLYGTFHLLRLLQTQSNINNLNIQESPKIKFRLLNHWDNLDRTVERGYAGSSIWDWPSLPGKISQRYLDYARTNASIGINGTVLNNVNASADILTHDYLIKVAALANVFRPYGIKVYLTARFSSPIEIGNLKTADPIDSNVSNWWKQKANEIYDLIPDFGGFLVKANSEGQPGPQSYGRSHTDGANMLADALAPHNGIVIWRAFVYSNEIQDDRAKQAYKEFKPLDGKFRKNVFVQVKNGPIDFQPREPFHPLFGNMPLTPLMMEFQITQEYLGFSTHLVYLASLFKEALSSDTYEKGKGSIVARIIDGSLEQHQLSGIAGVSNIGNDTNWCGSHFAQANWYAYGRLAWNHEISQETISDEWIRMTFTNNSKFIEPVKHIMLNSRETTVNYMTPLGLHHIMGYGHHHGPGPWIDSGREDWTSVYYHKADSIGIGFDRSLTGSKATELYYPEVAGNYNNLKTCPENLLLWFHHVNWDYKLKSGKILWDELCNKYYEGVDSVRSMQKTWGKLQGYIDGERYNEIKTFLAIQESEATLWRNACILYFQSKSKKPLPLDLELPPHPLEYYENIAKSYAP